MVRKDVLILISMLIVFVMAGMVSATDCWSTANSASESVCEANDDCQWKVDPWGSWCEQKGCWNFYGSDTCSQTNNASSTSYINTSCSWTSGATTGWCMELDCWSFDGNQSACEASDTYNMNCTWIDTYNEEDYHSPCMGPPEKGCWEKTTEATCTNITGCTWGMCEKQGCWDQTTAATCVATTGFNGQTCKWESNSNGNSWCSEAGCWDYNNQDACTAASCKWEGGSCYEQWCSDFGYRNESYCVNNSAGKNCNWNSPWCEESGCWSQTDSTSCAATNSSNGQSCFWDTYSGGWCEQIACWNWDGWTPEGNESNCLSNGTFYDLSCVWNNESGGTGGEDGWCYQDIGTKACSDKTNEVDCRDTSYCFWNFTGSTCQEPGTGTTTVWTPWYPGCEIMSSQSACGNVTGCSWTAGTSTCSGNATIVNTDPTIGGLRCEYLNNSNMCNKMTMLPFCCEWQGSACNESRLTTKCWDDMEETPEGAAYCEDYNAFTDETLCNQIAGDPWYFPCKWNNMSTSSSGDDRCTFKGDQIFVVGQESCVYIDSQQTCEAAGCKWVLDMYASTTDPTTAVSLPMGHCEDNYGDERNCNVECYACDYKTDKTNWTSATLARDACEGSQLGFCGFTADSNAENGYGKCRAKDEFRQGIAKNCDEDCGSCTFMGSPTSSSAENRPSYFCANSKVSGGCKWISDLDYPTDEAKGRCGKKADKTCEDRCDLCNTEDHCTGNGKKGGNSSFDTQCTWTANTNTCSLTTGGAQFEVCWDGEDNNNDGKMDCADSMCFSDPFCGGGFMAGTMDCFGFGSQTDCEAGGCYWTNENWGSWCDMPGAACWKLDGDQTSCDANGNCTWHSGFGGWCEENWTLMGSTTEGCMSYNQSSCLSNITSNCTWVEDDYHHDTFGEGGQAGWCQFGPDYYGDWYDCNNVGGGDGEIACATAGTADSGGNYPCEWVNSSGGFEGDTESYEEGWCDHMKYACYQYDTQAECTNQTVVNASANYNHSDFCIWRTDEGGSWCEGTTMSGEGSTDSCWNQNVQASCESSGCVWVSGFCDPVGFGSETGFGGTAGGGGFGGGEFGGGLGDSLAFESQGGFGMNCMVYAGNQTGCETQTGCGWYAESNPFCDINFATNCPQYSYNATICNSKPKCTYNTGANFCDEKPFSCFWNATLSANESSCQSANFCYWTDRNSCEPLAFNSSMSNQAICESYNVTNGTHTANETAFKWMNGWCEPGMAAQFFKNMEDGAPIPLGTDASGDVSQPEIDIVDFGMKDMGTSFGFGIRVDNIVNSSMCNGVKLTNGILGSGYTTTKFYWYLDTDGTATDGCTTRDSNALAGFEFYLVDSWRWASSDSTETTEAFRCDNGSWKKAPIPLTSSQYKACQEVGGGTIAVEKTELEKFPSLYTTGGDIRVYVATANATGNITNPIDTLGTNVGYATPGAIDQDIEKLDILKFKNVSERIGEGESGFIEYSDVDCWTETGCANYQCEGHPYCSENGYGVEATGFTDTRIPKAIGVVKETFPDAATVKIFTDKPSNMSLEYYNNDSECMVTSLNTTVNDIGVNNTDLDDYRLWHIMEIYNETLGGDNLPGGTHYFKVQFCDNESKCGSSKCTSLVTPNSENECAFCNFVSRVDVPSGWNVSFDLDQDDVYEFDQNAFNTTIGMLTNYSSGRRANIKLFTAENDSWVEFVDAKLSKTGLSSATRKIDNIASALPEGTTTDTSGNSIGYAGMVEDVRDRIVNNLFPEKCFVKIPKGDTSCDALWHCNNDLGNCVNRTAEATLNESGTDFCVWEIPNCEFSTWAGGQPGTTSSSSSSSSSSGGGGGSGGSGGGGGGSATGLTYVVNEDKFIAGYTRENMAVNTRLKFTVTDELHYMTVKALTSTKATITVESEPQEATLLIGELKKFDVNEDNYYDLSVKLDDINASSTGATFTIKSISELMPVTAEEDVEASPEEAVVEDVSGEVVAESAGEVAVEGRDWGKILVDLTWLWVTLALIIIAVIVGIIIHRRK